MGDPKDSFRRYQPDLGPSWLQDDGGRAFARGLGDAKDVLVDRLKRSVKARFPGIDYSPYDAIIEIGADRQIEIGPNESFATYAERLRIAWRTWPWAGTANGILSALYSTGYHDVFYMNVMGQQHTLATDGTNTASTTLSRAHLTGEATVDVDDASVFKTSGTVRIGEGTANVEDVYYSSITVNTLVLHGALTHDHSDDEIVRHKQITDLPDGSWMIDATSDFWSKFQLVFYPLPAAWAGVVPASNSDEADLLRRIVNKWRSAQSSFGGFIFIVAGGVWGYPLEFWDGSDTWNSDDDVVFWSE